MMTTIHMQTKFSISLPQPIPGLDGERLVVSNTHVAVVSSSQVQWLDRNEIKKLTLPQVKTKHSHWTSGGKEITVGIGKINIEEQQWESFPMLAQLEQHAPAGAQHTQISSVCWSMDGRFAVAVVNQIDETGSLVSEKLVYLFDTFENTIRFSISVEEIEEAIIVGNHILLLTETITVLNFSGEVISTLPTSRTKPYRFSRDHESGCLAILNHDWRIRLVDTNQWIVFAEKEGKFKDVSIHRNHLIALDLNDHLHAACIKDHALDWVGQAETGLVVNQIAIGDHDQLFLLGSGPTAVHKIEYSIACSE